jgi:hypothetical protein
LTHPYFTVRVRDSLRVHRVIVFIVPMTVGAFSLGVGI